MTKAEILEAVFTAPPETHDAILAAAHGSTRPRPGTVHDAANIGCCSPRTIQRYAERGLLQAIRISPRRVRFDLNQVETLFTRGAAAVRQKPSPSVTRGDV